MLPLLLMFLAIAGIHSLPLKENCIETEGTFHECLRKLYPDILLSQDMEGFNSQKTAFLKCGAEHSDCYLQKTLMTMINYLTEKPEEKLDFQHQECDQAMEPQQKCYEWPCNEHGFRVSWYERYFATYKCMKKVAKSYNCSPEYIEQKSQRENMYLRQHYEHRLTQFLSFVQLNAALDKNEPIVFSQPFRQPTHCKQSEKIFQLCMKDKASHNNTGNRAAYIQCGADKSKCYLQTHLMKMVNTVINTTNEPYEFVPKEYTKCEDTITKMDSIGLECLRSGFDEHGFRKPDREFEYNKARCKADMAQRSDTCSLNIVNMYRNEAIRKYENSLSEFSQYVNRHIK